ncbi:unnamed protein product [Diatraea saccharalis]|uniref:Uncharacterized protein n=1 Tax=Diatraea saccharalis TaxID=40085 RepID=A0A9N9R4M4_9NEOP|nr:unnamed protein product [Diatraea saccharalis]
MVPLHFIAKVDLYAKCVFNITARISIKKTDFPCYRVQLDGKWYIAAIASDLRVEADCAMLMFNHMNSTDVSISWVANNSISYYNGSVSIIVDPNSNSTVLGDLLQVTYTDEIWKLTRTPHLKESDAAKLDQAIANYSLQATKFKMFNNTEDTCSISGGFHLDPSIVLTSAAALTMFRMFY